MEKEREIVRKVSRSRIETARRGKLGCFPADLYSEIVRVEEEKGAGSGVVRTRVLPA